MSATQAPANTRSPDASKDRDRRKRAEPSQEQQAKWEMVFVPFEGFLGTSASKELIRRSLADEAQRKPEGRDDGILPLDALLGTSMMEPPIERHAAIISDPRFSHPANAPTSSRIVNRLHQTYGNGHLQRVTDHIRAARDELSHGSIVQLVEGGRKPDELDPELERLLESIETKKAPPVPAFEAITGTTYAEKSGGELESKIQSLWVRKRLSFTEAARRAAREDVGRRGAPRVPQSPHIKPARPYARRWALNLFAWDYPKRKKDLPEIRKLLRRGSPFQQSLAAEFDNVIPVRNPSAAQIRARIIDAVFDLFASLKGGEIGELVVTFSGHGGGGSVLGVDNKWIKARDLAELAEFARDWDIHIVYILDTCRAGPLTQIAREYAIRDIKKRLSGLPPEQRKAAQRQMALVDRLWQLMRDVTRATADMLAAAKKYRRRRTRNNFRGFFTSLSGLSDRVNELGFYLREGDFTREDVPGISDVQKHLAEASLFIVLAYGGDRRTLKQMLRKLAVLLDTLGDAVNKLIIELNEKTKATKAV